MAPDSLAGSGTVLLGEHPRDREAAVLAYLLASSSSRCWRAQTGCCSPGRGTGQGQGGQPSKKQRPVQQQQSVVPGKEGHGDGEGGGAARAAAPRTKARRIWRGGLMRVVALQFQFSTEGRSQRIEATKPAFLRARQPPCPSLTCPRWRRRRPCPMRGGDHSPRRPPMLHLLRHLLLLLPPLLLLRRRPHRSTVKSLRPRSRSTPASPVGSRKPSSGSRARSQRRLIEPSLQPRRSASTTAT